MCLGSYLANHDQLGEANLVDKCETSIETNMTRAEEDLVVLWRWSGSRKKKSTVVAGSTTICPKIGHSAVHQYV